MNKKQVEQAADVASIPALRLIFDGLFFLCFNTDGNQAINDPVDECRVGFITTAPRHLITITGQQTAPDGRVVTKGFNRNFTHAQARKMQIDLDVPGAPPQSVRRRGYDPAFNRLAAKRPPGDSFQWIIDLENSDLHNTKLKLIPEVLKPVMHIHIGEFYTEELSVVKYFRTKPGEERPGEDDPPNFGEAAVLTGVIIDTLPQGKAFLKLGDEPLSLIADAGLTYEVIFKNQCPPCEVQDPKIEALHLSDFSHHYHAFEVIAPSQFDLDYHEAGTGAPPAICYAASGSRTTDI